MPILVAGHLCLDVTPAFESPTDLAPGSLVRVGPATISTGGVSNVGVALARLGVPVRLAHRIGDDPFGSIVRSILDATAPHLADSVRTVDGEATSYSLVIARPGEDRMFIHHPGANDRFTPADIAETALRSASHLHFGYPPVMRGIYADGGEALASLFARARSAGTTTSLDLCSVDPASDAGRVDWRAFLARVLPSVDLFAPSFDELAFMLGRPTQLDPDAIRSMASLALAMGCAEVLLKLGHHGLFYASRSTHRHEPCRSVDVVNTCGAGDCTIAGFLAARSRGEDVATALRIACAVGATCCEGPDATSGVRPLAEIDARLDAGWPALHTPLFPGGAP